MSPSTPQGCGGPTSGRPPASPSVDGVNSNAHAEESNASHVLPSHQDRRSSDEEGNSAAVAHNATVKECYGSNSSPSRSEDQARNIEDSSEEHSHHVAPACLPARFAVGRTPGMDSEHWSEKFAESSAKSAHDSSGIRDDSVGRMPGTEVEESNSINIPKCRSDDHSSNVAGDSEEGFHNAAHSSSPRPSTIGMAPRKDSDRWREKLAASNNKSAQDTFGVQERVSSPRARGHSISRTDSDRWRKKLEASNAKSHISLPFKGFLHTVPNKRPTLSTRTKSDRWREKMEASNSKSSLTTTSPSEGDPPQNTTPSTTTHSDRWREKLEASSSKSLWTMGQKGGLSSSPHERADRWREKMESCNNKLLELGQGCRPHSSVSQTRTSRTHMDRWREKLDAKSSDSTTRQQGRNGTPPCGNKPSSSGSRSEQNTDSWDENGGPPNFRPGAFDVPGNAIDDPASRNSLDTDSWDENLEHVESATTPTMSVSHVRPGAYAVPDNSVGRPSSAAQGHHRTRTSSSSGEEEFHTVAADAFVVAPSNWDSMPERSESRDVLQAAVVASDKRAIDFRDRRIQAVLVIVISITFALALSLAIVLSGDRSPGEPENPPGQSATSFPHAGLPTTTEFPSTFPTPAPTTLLWKQVGSSIDGQSEKNELGISIGLSSDGGRLAVAGEVDNMGLTRDPYVRVYQYREDNWILHGNDILGRAGTGHSVALSGDGNRVARGDRLGGSGWGRSPGRVQVFEFQTDSWNPIGNSIVSDTMGTSFVLSRDGNVIAVGTPHYEIDGMGRVRLLEFSNGNWTQLGAEIYGDAIMGLFGRAVSLSDNGHVVAVGATSHHHSGMVRVYTYTNNTWVQLGQELRGDVIFDNFGFGVSLSANGTIMAVAAPWNDDVAEKSGQVKVYQYDHSLQTWEQLGGDIVGEAAGDEFGFAVSLSSDGCTLAASSPFRRVNVFHTGQVRIYKFLNATWQLLGGELDGGGSFGAALSLSADGRRVAVGAPHYGGNGQNSGRVYVFELQPAHGTYPLTNPTPTSVPTTEPTASPPCGESEMRFELNLLTDYNGEEISWNLVDGNSSVVASGSSYDRMKTYLFRQCLALGCYGFTIFDSRGDGLNFGNYSVIVDGDVIASRDPLSFYFSESTAFGDCHSTPTTEPTASPPCGEGEIRFELNLVTDDWGDETSWNLLDGNSSVVASGSSYDRTKAYLFRRCLAQGCYGFTIFDSAGDGICCGGGYSVSVDGDVVTSDGHFSFGSSESTAFGDCKV